MNQPPDANPESVGKEPLRVRRFVPRYLDPASRLGEVLVHVVGEQATELIHIGLIAVLAGVSANLFNRVCFNYPALGDLYK